MMFHSCGLSCGQEIAARRFKEFHHGLVFPRRCVCDINNDLSALERIIQSLTSKRVNARGWRRRHNLMALQLQVLHEPGSDEPSAANYYDFHFFHKCLCKIFSQQHRRTKAPACDRFESVTNLNSEAQKSVYHFQLNLMHASN